MQYNQNLDDNPSLFSKHAGECLPSVQASLLVEIFNQSFAHKSVSDADKKTYLIGGASEPIYLPANENPQDYFEQLVSAETNHAHAKLQWLGEQSLSSLPEGNKIFFNRDYFASALHEVAHWCIAGEARRKQVDYGYWYAPDGRNLEQQLMFENVEVKPQAIEYAFASACNIPWSISTDNLVLTDYDKSRFENAVKQQLLIYSEKGFPARAEHFLSLLRSHYQEPNTSSSR